MLTSRFLRLLASVVGLLFALPLAAEACCSYTNVDGAGSTVATEVGIDGAAPPSNNKPQTSPSGGGGNSGAPPDPCEYEIASTNSISPVYAQQFGLPEYANGGTFYRRLCPGDEDWEMIFVPAGQTPAQAPPSPASLAQQARSTMTVVTPQIVLDPFYLLEDGRRATLKNIETWLWTDAANWTSQTDRLEVGPVWVEVTAIPRTIVVTPNDGVTETMMCAGPGTPIPPNTPVSEPSPDCSLKFLEQTNGDTWPVTVSVIYDANWVGSNGTTSVGGELPDLVSAPVTIPLAVLTAKPQLVDPNGD